MVRTWNAWRWVARDAVASRTRSDEVAMVFSGGDERCDCDKRKIL